MNKKVLFIEDDQIFANIYRNKLLLDGFQVELAYDGEAGLELLKTFRPDAVILDLILPNIQGVDVIRKIRQETEFQQLPVIVFTNTFLTSTMQEAWKAGATKCLAKSSCTPHQVIGTLTSVLSNGAGHKPVPATALAEPVPPDEVTDDADKAFETELRKAFIDAWPATLAAIRIRLQNMIKAENEGARIQEIQELYRRIHALTGSASITGMSNVALLTDALEALLRELQDHPHSINASTMRTVASAVDCVGILFGQGKPEERTHPPKVLVVDDEVIAVRAIVYALNKAKLKSVSVEDPLKALDLLAQDRFDLIFLDVGLPHMNGFELCTKLRALPRHKKTPVVFITSLNDFECRTNSSMSGGNDFIAKPFMFIELAVKALIYVLRGQIQTPKV